MAVNGEGIYDTHPIRPYASANQRVYLTQSKDSLNTYAFYLSDPATPDVTLPSEITIDRFTPAAKAKVTLLGARKNLKWHEDGKNMVITLPSSLQNKIVGHHAVTFRISA